jgi:hypothetical protein
MDSFLERPHKKEHDCDDQENDETDEKVTCLVCSFEGNTDFAGVRKVDYPPRGCRFAVKKSASALGARRNGS